ncbi:MAG: aldo/keto reductase [Thermoguttaceae bacterium]|nr:aldo/keto reductase [Thermoguttaceae bacterium]
MEYPCMRHGGVNRRDFVKASGAAVAFGATAAMLGGNIKIVQAGNPDGQDTSSILNYVPEMEYRRCGRTDLMVSAISLGGHWKRLGDLLSREGVKQTGNSWLGTDIDNPMFVENRDKIISRCIERGINYVDACTHEEIRTYARVLKGRRDKMYFGYSWDIWECRDPAWRPLDRLKEGFATGLKTAGLEYVDLWRIMFLEQSGQHEEKDVEAAMEALRWAKKEGLARFTGLSSHDRPHIMHMLDTYPDAIDVVVTPYFANTKVVTDESGLWARLKKNDIGWFGIKPFASHSVFKGTSMPGDPNEKEDNRLARMLLRSELCNEALTAPIPGLITEQQVDNAAMAILERRKLDLNEQAEVEQTMQRAFASLPSHHEFFRDWTVV